MIKLNVPDMSCGHCVKSITSAIQGKYSGALVVCNLQDKSVTVEKGPTVSELRATLNEAGYKSTIA